MHHALRLLLHLLPWALAVPWCVRLVESAIGLRSVPDLQLSRYNQSPDQDPALTVIVPARNEAGRIADCLRSLVEQDYQNLRIIAVDDRSTDATGAIMDDLSAAAPHRPEAIHITQLPEGWVGKNHALAVAARKGIADGAEFLLFTDGDIVFSREILRRALAYAQSVSADHLVVFPTTLAHSRGESMLLACLHVLGMFAVRPWKIADPRANDAVGVGAFNLVRREAYLQLGGFDAMPLEVLEDLTLGRRVKRAGMRQRVAYAPGAVAVHWAPGLLGVLHGMTKNIFAVFRFRPAMLLAGAIGLAVLWIGPFVLLFIPGARLATTVAILGILGMYGVVSRRSLFSPLWAVTAPLAAALLVYSMLRSMGVTLYRGGVTWRGTFYPLNVLRQAVRADRRND